MKNFLKSFLRSTPYRVIRATDYNRFQAIDQAMASLGRRGYRPRVIIDGGANIGSFAREMRGLFEDAMIHLVEPQPLCRAPLEQLARDANYKFHPVALGSVDGPATVQLAVDPAAVSTGAHIVASGQKPAMTADVPLKTLDEILVPALTRADRALLKMDLQGYEMEALRGADQSLVAIEVVLCESSFYAQAYEPSIADLVAFFAARRFSLHDVAALSARRRDNRAHQADFVFVRDDSPLAQDNSWG